MNIAKKAAQWLFQKALGFPVWRGSTQDIPPGGWGSLDPYGSYTQLLDIPAFVGCVRVLGGAVGSLPWHVYVENKSGVREKAKDDPRYSILHDSPNANNTTMEFLQFVMLSYCWSGNAYAEIGRLGKNVTSLNPLQAQRMRPKLGSAGLVYEYTYDDGRPERFPPEKIFHLKNFSRDGIEGLPHVPPALLERALVTHRFGAAILRNQGVPGVVLESDKPKPKDEKYVDRLRKDWKTLFGGDNVGNTGVLFDGMKAHILSTNPDNLQYIETMKELDAQFAAVFGIPLNLLQQADKTATYASAEQFDLQFVKYVLGPLCKAIEQAMNKKIFAGQPTFSSEFDLDGLMRGDSKSQAEYFATMVDHGVMKRNEARRKLNLPEDPAADKLTVQSQFVDLDKLPDLSAAATPGLVQGDIRKSYSPHIPAESSGHALNVVTTLAKEQLNEIAELTVIGMSKKRRIGKVLRDEQGAITGTEVVYK